jgi:hypothetical protein
MLVPRCFWCNRTATLPATFLGRKQAKQKEKENGTRIVWYYSFKAEVCGSKLE